MIGLTGLSGMSGQVPVTVDSAAPTISSIVVATKATADKVVITFSERVRSTHPDYGWSVTVGGVARAVSSAVLADDWLSITLTLESAVAQGATVLVSYVKNTGDVVDVAGNLLDDVTDHAVTNSVDTTVPTLSTAVIANAAPANVVLTFNEAVTSPGTDYSLGWSVTVGGTPVDIDSFAHSGSAEITLTLADPVTYGQAVKAIYAAGTGDLTDVQGNALASITAPGRTVTNNVADVTAPTLASATIENAAPTKIVLTFDEDVVATNYLNGWMARKAGAQVGLSAGARQTDHKVVHLTLAEAAANGEVFTLYYDADAGDLADLSANPFASLTAQAVTNNVA